MREFYEPNDYREFLSSMARLAFAAKDYYELAMMIKNSENFSIIKKRVKATPTTTYL